jgi:hypothetical protein
MSALSPNFRLSPSSPAPDSAQELTGPSTDDQSWTSSDGEWFSPDHPDCPTALAAKVKRNLQPAEARTCSAQRYFMVTIYGAESWPAFANEGSGSR